MKEIICGGPGEIVRPGGNMANAGTTLMLLKLVTQQKVPAEKFVTHRSGFDQFIEAYDTLARAAETKALKVVIAA